MGKHQSKGGGGRESRLGDGSLLSGAGSPNESPDDSATEEWGLNGCTGTKADKPFSWCFQ